MFEPRPIPDQHLDSAWRSGTTDPAFDVAFTQLVAAWENHHALQSSADMGGRMHALLRLDAQRRHVSQHRRRLAA
jgi:hypothetical protein